MTESGSQSSGPSKKGTSQRTSTSTTKKSTADKSTAEKSTGRSSGAAPRKRAPRAEAREAPKAMSGSRVAAEAVRQFGELSTKEVEGVTSLRRTEEGWVVELDVLELRRIPETTDVLGLYEVSLDTSGQLEGYRRAHRYVRGQTED